MRIKADTQQPFEELLAAWDGEEVITRFDREASSWIVIAIHSTVLGPAVGGTRMKSYPTVAAAVADALRLAAGMTYKWAAADFPRGGGKAVIAVPGSLDAASRSALVHRYALLLRDLGGLFTTGPDVGTSPEDMDVIAGIAPGRAFSRSEAAGGAGDSAAPTALGVFAAIATAWELLSGAATLRGASVLVEGAGNVGSRLIERLLDAGADVRFSDVDPRRIETWIARGVSFVPPADVPAHECDVYAPCALGGTLNRTTIPQLRCRIVAGAANNQLAEPDDAERLRSRGILYVPDFIANAGGAVTIAGREALGWSADDAERRVRGIATAVREIITRATRDGISPEEAARRLAESRLHRAR